MLHQLYHAQTNKEKRTIPRSKGRCTSCFTSLHPCSMCLNGRETLFCHGNVVWTDTISCCVGGSHNSNERWAFGVSDLARVTRSCHIEQVLKVQYVTYCTFKTYSTIAELSAALIDPDEGISSWGHINAVLPQNVTSLSHTRPERLSPCSSVHNIEISQSLWGYCACVRLQSESQCVKEEEEEEMTMTVVTQLGRPVALPAVNGFRGRLEKPVCQWLFTHHPVCKTSVCLNLIAFAQSHAIAAS